MDVTGALFALMIVVVLAEMYLSARWVPFYFLRGLKVYGKSKSLLSMDDGPLDLERLEELAESWMGQAIIFREIGPGTYAFREKMMGFSFFNYSPVMHGLLFVDRVSATVHVKGFANWFIIAFTVMWLAVHLLVFPYHESTLLMIGALPLFLALIYFIQARRYNKIFNFVTASNEHMGE